MSMSVIEAPVPEQSGDEVNHKLEQGEGEVNHEPEQGEDRQEETCKGMCASIFL